MQAVQVRKIDCRGFSVDVQFNPKRIRSTAAVLDPATLRTRECFLCLEHLPEPQKGILYRDEFLLLCNPAPIFPYHMTLASIHHKPQELEPSLHLLLDVAKDLSPEFTVFYNGPKCGASAPDHLHFQTSPRRSIPIEIDAVDMKRRKRIYYKNHVAGCLLLQYGRTVLILESTDRERLLEFLGGLFSLWKNTLHTSEEPKVNVICSYQEDIWRLMILPREKHRPQIYFQDEKTRILVSPAAMDMGGFIITPREQDFVRFDARCIEDIYAEVSRPSEEIENILESMR